MNKCEPPRHAQKFSKHVSTQQAFFKNSTSMTSTTEQASAVARRGGAAAFLNCSYTCTLVYLIGLIASCHTTITPAGEHKEIQPWLGGKGAKPRGP